MFAFLVVWVFWMFFKVGADLSIGNCSRTNGVQCLKNDDIGYRQGNIYFCNDPDLSECCEMDSEFTCCEPNYVKNTREQIKLWCSVCIFLLIIVAVYMCLHRDVQWISSQTVQESFGLRNRCEDGPSTSQT